MSATAVTSAYRFALDPCPDQVRALASHAGAARFAFNHMLALVKAQLDQRDAERSYGVAEELLAPAAGWSLYGLRREWNQRKHVAAPWWEANSKEAYNSGLLALSQALTNWAVLTASLVRFFHHGCATPEGAAVPNHQPVGAYPVLGVDVGVKADALIVAATPQGEQVARWRAPQSLSKVQARLKRLGRRSARRDGSWKPDRDSPTGGRWQTASNRWLRTQKQVANVHRKAANIRTDVLHKATTELARLADVVVVEDLNVAGMARSKPGAGAGGRGLNRSIHDAALATIRTQLGYKTGWYGSELVVIDRWYPSSKTCSQCGAVKTKLSLAEREYVCEHCGLVIDRDHNAAINIARTGRQQLAPQTVPSGSAPEAGRGGNRKTRPVKTVKAGAWETSNPHHHQVGKTGSATPQGEAAA